MPTLLRSAMWASRSTPPNTRVVADKAVERGGSVIYRRKDIEQFDRSLRLVGCAIEELDFEAGAEPHDLAYDYPPYYSNDRQQVKLSLDGHISTSMLLIIRKAF